MSTQAFAHADTDAAALEIAFIVADYDENVKDLNETLAKLAKCRAGALHSASILTGALSAMDKAVRQAHESEEDDADEISYELAEAARFLNSRRVEWDLVGRVARESISTVMARLPHIESVDPDINLGAADLPLLLRIANDSTN